MTTETIVFFGWMRCSINKCWSTIECTSNNIDGSGSPMICVVDSSIVVQCYIVVRCFHPSLGWHDLIGWSWLMTTHQCPMGFHWFDPFHCRCPRLHHSIVVDSHLSWRIVLMIRLLFSCYCNRFVRFLLIAVWLHSNNRSSYCSGKRRKLCWRAVIDCTHLHLRFS